METWNPQDAAFFLQKQFSIFIYISLKCAMSEIILTSFSVYFIFFAEHLFPCFLWYFHEIFGAKLQVFEVGRPPYHHSNLLLLPTARVLSGPLQNVGNMLVKLKDYFKPKYARG
ncbi:hypothetical protein ATANTOWER_011487 [Ataeniobius toweri]|uniref:Uncharacterized protein n=1 Tax=Ataeniobius toweri TaxID=208326 RepID=A0ABU7A1A7_9TELE|nr:hypothetical protein [Ataeniobius toweri]